MRRKFCLGIVSILTLGAVASMADIVVPGSNGTSGVLNVTEDTTIDLSLAADGQWDGANTASGIYDSDQWAVVFNYSSVTVAEGATLTFSNHASKAPVVWLVTGDVTIAGTVSLNGQSRQPAPNLSEPGPGGFRGGAATFASGPRGGAGFGPGGGNQQNNNAGQGGSYGTGTGGSGVYGNPSLVPLIGGSGGAGDPEFSGNREGAGAGGGAILIASRGAVIISGEIRANGGAGINNFSGTDNNTGGGSGGGIRIVCNTFSGTGALNALGGGGWWTGGLGRIRLERVAFDGDQTITPDPSVVPLTDGDTALIWPPATAPVVKVISIGNETAPDDPRAAFGAAGADITLGETQSTPIVIETRNVEQASAVEVRVTPRSNANAQVIPATVQSVVSTDPLVVRWIADLPVNTGYSAVQVKVVRP